MTPSPNAFPLVACLGALAALAAVGCEASPTAADPTLAGVETGGLSADRVDRAGRVEGEPDSPAPPPDAEGPDGDSVPTSRDPEPIAAAEPADADAASDLDRPDDSEIAAVDDTPASPDAGDAEVSEPDPGPPKALLGEPCLEDADCEAGPCVPDHLGPVCSGPCEDKCPKGFGCSDDGLCLPLFPLLCYPCSENADCWPDGQDDGARCVVYGPELRFCGGACKKAKCPGDHACWNVPDPAGKGSFQCIKAQGVCGCTPPAIEDGAGTFCSLSNEFGTCTGEKPCSESGLGPCDAPAAAPEACNGADDDCDGATDEPGAEGCSIHYADQDHDGAGSDTAGSLCLCGPSSPWTATTAGDCDDGDAAVGPSSADLCDGADDDCDGFTDEAFPLLGAPCDGADSDLCEHGLLVCTPDGGWVYCPTESKTGIAETCDGQDEDCDGKTDEDFALLGKPCDSDDSDLCEHGVFTCAGGGAGVTCEAEVVTDLAEICDGTDEDCDGAVDEDFPELGTPCDGDDSDSCAYGPYECAAGGAGVACPNEVLTGLVELCNGADDDCDGSTDEGFGVGDPCGTGACAGGAVECQSGDVTVCSTHQDGSTPKQGAETCNGADNDCDGSVDEGAGCPCPVHQYGGHGYLFCGTPLGWNAAHAACHASGYHLTSLQDAAEHGFVEQVADSYSLQPWWIGLHDQAVEGLFVWEDGKPVTYAPWFVGEPNDFGAGEDCAELNRFHPATGWNDSTCSLASRYVCESP